MKKYFYFLHIQFKSAIKILPKLFAGTLLFAFIALLTGYAGTKTLYNSNRVFFFKIAAILPENDALVDMGFGMLTEMGNLDNFCEIIRTDEESALTMLRDGEVYCVIYIPEGFVEDVMNGTNTPAKIIIPDNAGLETLVFKSVLNAGASSLAYAQAGIYSVSDIYYYNDFDNIEEVIDDINEEYIRFVFNRGSFNKMTTLESTLSLTLTQFYVCCGLCMFMLFLGLSLGGFIKQETDITTSMLKREGISLSYQIIVKTLVVTLIQSTLLLLILLGVNIYADVFASLDTYKAISPLLVKFTPVNLLYIIICELVAISYIILIYELAGTGLYGMLLLFLLNTVMMFTSGIIIPAAYLPKAVNLCGNLLPTAGIRELLKSLYTGNTSLLGIGICFIYTIIFTTISTIIRHIHKEGRN